jgi:N-acetylmuramoyl-L-alanine amidase
MQMRDKGKKAVGILVVVLVFCAGMAETGKAVYTWTQSRGDSSRYTVAIDPGHGGIDPGKIGINDAREKDVNLAISFMLKEILEQNDCKVVMTRTEDEGLYQEGDSNKKVADLRERCRIIDDCNPDIAISIHQNSFTSESSHGAQVFYQAASDSGKQLAQTIQKQMVSSLDPENGRDAKANSDYFMLKNTGRTIVIVECGFLSNSQEAQLLTMESYQRRVAWSVALGALQYLAANQSAAE